MATTNFNVKQLVKKTLNTSTNQLIGILTLLLSPFGRMRIGTPGKKQTKKSKKEVGPNPQEDGPIRW